MSTLAITPLLRLLDSVAAGVGVFACALGAGASDPDSVSEGIANNIQTLLDAQGEDDELDAGDLLAECRRRQALVTAGALYRSLQGERLQLALDAHYGGTGALNRFLAAGDARVHPYLRRVGIQVDAANAFPPEVVALATIAATDAATATFTPGSAVDTALYGKANCALRTTSVIGSTTTLTLTLTKIDGTSETQDVVVPSGTAANERFVIGTPGTDMYVACTAVTIAGATAGNTFAIRTEVERSLVL